MIRRKSIAFGLMIVAIANLVALPLLAQEAPLPGVEIDRSPDFENVYVGCPSLVVMPDGSYVASHSWFGPGTTNDVTVVFSSSDRGKTWEKKSEIKGQWWSSLFVHRENLYIIGTSGRYGNAVIRRSRDGGASWTTPKDNKSGLLADDARYHSAPVPVIEHQGRIVRGFEDIEAGGGWGKCFRSMVFSADADSDLLHANNWEITNRLHPNPEWIGGERPGWLEGNVVATPEGKLFNILRVSGRPETAAVTTVAADGTTSFDPRRGFVNFPGGGSKFTIRYDETSGRYWSLVNKQAGPDAYRNVLALISSPDLRTWRVNTILLRHIDRRKHALQYVDWQFDGPDIIAVSRTSWGNSNSAHDANYLTFHRARKFRELTMDDAPGWLGRGEPVEFEAGDLVITGHGIELKPFVNDGIAFANRKYRWQNIPSNMAGARYTQTSGGVPAEITVRAIRNTTVYVTSAIVQEPVDFTDWERIPVIEINYSDHQNTPMAVYRRSLARGQTLKIPQGNWSGTLVLIPAD